MLDVCHLVWKSVTLSMKDSHLAKLISIVCFQPVYYFDNRVLTYIYSLTLKLGGFVPKMFLKDIYIVSLLTLCLASIFGGIYVVVQHTAEVNMLRKSLLQTQLTSVELREELDFYNLQPDDSSLDITHHFSLNNEQEKEQEQTTTFSIYAQVYQRIRNISATEQKHVLVTGGAGFVGSHLVDVLMLQGHKVTVVDNLFSGRRENIRHWFHHPNFTFLVRDVADPLLIPVDEIYHLACPASPPHYQYSPLFTLRTSTVGTSNMLDLAARTGATLLLASTSEVYGDPLEHPQSETYVKTPLTRV